jgi:hypothetical protein
MGVEPAPLDFRQAMQGGEVREIEWAPPKEAPPVFVAEENPPEEYGPWQWAAAFGRATGRFGAEDFTLQENGRLRCPAGASLWLSESPSCSERCAGSMWPVERFAVPGPPTGAGNMWRCFPWLGPSRRPSLLLVHLVPCGRHHRWSWHDRLARNAGFGPPQFRVTVAGVPAFLAMK